MNSFEAARQSARDLRCEILATGVVPDRPLDVVNEVAKRLGLEVIWLDPSDPALNRSFAVWEPQAPIVKCANTGTPGERALLLAHELAHEKMHKLFPGAFPASTAKARIEASDYGPEERREQEAEVFARELLVPMDDLRRSYLRPGVTGQDIAVSLGLPRGVVDRQLLDALLLPSAPVERRTTRQSVEPDPSQIAAATHEKGPFLLQAGPGTGKTSTLVSRVLKLVERKVDPAKILVLTFSKRAASEVAERIATALPEAGSRVWVGTFHQFGMDVISRHYDQLGLPPKPVARQRRWPMRDSSRWPVGLAARRA